MFKPLKHPNVKIVKGPKQLVGKTGEIFGRDGKLHQVRLDQPVELPELGVVTEHLFETSALKIIRPPKPVTATAPAPVIVAPVTETAPIVEPTAEPVIEDRTTELSPVFDQLGLAKPSDEPVADKPLSKRQQKLAEKRAKMAADPELQAAREVAEAAVLATPEGRLAGAKKQLRAAKSAKKSKR